MKTLMDDRFVEPMVLLSRGIAFDPEPKLGNRARPLMELVKANNRYSLRMFEGGKPTANFVGRDFFPGQESVFDLKVSASRIANLVSPEVIRLAWLGSLQNFVFTFTYVRPNKSGAEETYCRQTFCLEQWHSVRVEVVCDGREEKLTLTKYCVK